MNAQRSPILSITPALFFALIAGCGSSALDQGSDAAPTDEAGAFQNTPDGSSRASGLCPAAGFAPDRALLGWSDGASVNLLFSDGEVRQVQPIPPPGPVATPELSVLRLQAGTDGWSFATRGSGDRSDETSQVAILRPDGSTLWLGRIQTTYPYDAVFAGPHGAVISPGGKLLIFIDSGGHAVERKDAAYVRALGGVGAAGEVLAGWEERLGTGEVLDHLAFYQSAVPRIELPAVLRWRWVLVGEAFHYVEAASGDLVWHREGLTAHQTVLQVPNTADGVLAHHGAWVVLSANGLPMAVAREDGSDARLVPSQVTSPPTYNTSANGDWLVGSAEFGEPIWRLNMKTGALEDLSNTRFGTRRIFDAAFCTPPLLTDAQGRMLLGLRDDALGGLFREVSGQAGNWEAMGRPVRGVTYVKATAWGDTVVASAETGENTYCPDKFGEWPAQTDNRDVLAGASVQLFHPNTQPRLLHDELVMHPGGKCAVLWTPGVGAEILDVPTGATHAIPTSVLRPVWLQ